MEFQVFDMTDPKCKLLQVIEANSKTEALAKAQAINKNYAVAPMPPKVGARPRESGRAYNVELREASPTLGQLQSLVMDAVSRDVAGSYDVEIFMDGTLRYAVDTDLFQRTWSIGDDGALTLGQPQQVELVAQPVEASRSGSPSLLEASRAFNPNESESFHRAFAEGRDGSVTVGGDTRLRDLFRISETWNPGKSASFHAEFLKGRDGTGNTLADAAKSLGLEGGMLREFLRGRS
jgi:hypothetical protein